MASHLSLLLKGILSSRVKCPEYIWLIKHLHLILNSDKNLPCLSPTLLEKFSFTSKALQSLVHLGFLYSRRSVATASQPPCFLHPLYSNHFQPRPTIFYTVFISRLEQKMEVDRKEVTAGEITNASTILDGKCKG